MFYPETIHLTNYFVLEVVKVEIKKNNALECVFLLENKIKKNRRYWGNTAGTLTSF